MRRLWLRLAFELLAVDCVIIHQRVTICKTGVVTLIMVRGIRRVDKGGDTFLEKSQNSCLPVT